MKKLQNSTACFKRRTLLNRIGSFFNIELIRFDLVKKYEFGTPRVVIDFL